MAVVQAEAGRHGLPLAIAIGKAGSAAGLVGGLAMAAFLMVFTVYTGQGLLTPLQLFGGTFYGRAALDSGFGSAFWGLALHLAVSIAFGVLFAAMFRRDAPPLFEVVSAIVYALALWVVLTFAVMPVVDPVMRQAIPGMSFAWFGAHVVYGCGVGLTQQLRHVV